MIKRAAVIACMMHGCGDPSHVYDGRLYREDRDCFGTTSALDVVTGDDPGTCEPTCFVQTSPEAGRAYYVSRMCAPYPATGFDRPAGDPVCARALAAYARNDTCFVDGGTSNPLPRDASAD
jgi:hypothetical protein